MPEDIKDSSLEESLQLLKDNPPVEPDKDELEDIVDQNVNLNYSENNQEENKGPPKVIAKKRGEKIQRPEKKYRSLLEAL